MLIYFEKESFGILLNMSSSLDIINEKDLGNPLDLHISVLT